MPPLTFGLALDFASSSAPLHQSIQNTLPLIRSAERLGFKWIVAGESYTTRPSSGHLPSPLLALSYLAPQTSLRLATGVVLVPAWPTLRLAYDSAVLDQLSGGRFTLGVGLGHRAAWERFGFQHDGAMGNYLDDALAALKALWRGEPGYQGPMVKIDRGLAPTPLQEGGVPLWVGGRVPRAVRRAAISGDGWYAATYYGRSEVAQLGERYRAALAAVDRDPAAASIVVNRLCCVADTLEEVYAEGGPFVERTLRHYAAMGSLGVASPPGTGPALDAARGEVALVGTPEMVAEQVEQYVAAGVTHLQLRVAPSDMPAAVAERTVALVGEQVLPRFAQ
jgi:alkanesulfonate monooxygenase SsuD/methylene tetrahydromethanopterin reductase-like flavin-dependent oxidoreductase (luciferase family)